MFTIGRIAGYCAGVIVTSRQELFEPAADEMRFSTCTDSYLDTTMMSGNGTTKIIQVDGQQGYNIWVVFDYQYFSHSDHITSGYKNQQKSPKASL
ncbi:hypothetical protein [Chitinophaga sp. MD30]|uniref:hypothetical protein n=1 Tax=Chitinophaga sp. MD30 TaxID=2033437 RepID=UPI000BAEB89C|nr:hypothetical protein [Chitinophaga sp. MD30]ASZ11940.1 hypothetical protein CK934_13715 [Chitinophaga sp. MD30]